MDALPLGSVGSGFVRFSLRLHGCYCLLSLFLPCQERHRFRTGALGWLKLLPPFLGWVGPCGGFQVAAMPREYVRLFTGIGVFSLHSRPSVWDRYRSLRCPVPLVLRTLFRSPKGRLVAKRYLAFAGIRCL